MKIHVHSITWNDELILPYFLRHYEKFADKIHIHDNKSTDKTLEILRSHSLTEVYSYDSEEHFHEPLVTSLRNHAWKRSRGSADWVIVVDSDEFLISCNMIECLQNCQVAGITIPLTEGYEMVGDTFPAGSGQIYNEISEGVFDDSGYSSKAVVFNPNAISEINYTYGAHHAYPVGTVNYSPDSGLKLLHYRFLGLDYVAERWALRRQRLSEWNLSRNLCNHYHITREDLLSRYSSLRAIARPVLEGLRSAPNGSGQNAKTDYSGLPTGCIHE